MTAYRAWLHSIFIEAMALNARVNREPHSEAEWKVEPDATIAAESKVAVAALIGAVRLEWAREPGSKATVREMAGYFSRRGGR